MNPEKHSASAEPTRRAFLELSALAAAAGVFLRPGTARAATRQAFGVQLFMVRALVGKDLPGVFRAIRAAGYQQVETFPGVYNHPAKELRAIIEDAGLIVPSGHFDYAGFESKIGYARDLGLSFMVCPALPKEQWNAAGFRKAAADFNKWGMAVQDEGMHFAFHNHDYEFQPREDGRTGWSVLMEQTNPGYVGLEIDCYWAVQAGQDPLQMLTTYPDRVHLLHLKDRTAGARVSYDMGPSSAHFTELGKGTIGWKPLIEKAQAQGVRYFFLDQDQTQGSPLESMKISYRYLQSIVA